MPLPLHEPSTCQTHPIEADVDIDSFAIRDIGHIRTAHLSPRVDQVKGLFGIQDAVYHITNSLIAAREVIEDLAVDGCGDPDLFGAISPVENTMSSPQA